MIDLKMRQPFNNENDLLTFYALFLIIQSLSIIFENKI